MTIASEISRLQAAKASIKAAIESQWVTVPSSATLDSYATYINAISCACPFWETITVSWTEASDPAQFNPVWSDWAADAVAWDPRFDDWFWYSAVLLNTSWTVTSRMNQEWWEFSWVMSTLWNITSWDNVMIEFPVRWIKMTKSWSTITLSMTKKLNETWYQYYAFNRNWTIKDNLYLWAYKWSRVNNILKSRSWQAKATSNTWNWVWYISLSNTTTWARACARANNTSISTWSNWWDEITWYARNYVNALYMMKYGNPNSQSVVWQWYIWWSSVVNTWWTDNQTSATYWTSSNTVQCKLFWLEDRWGNCYEWLDWAFYNSSTNLRTATTNVLTNTSWSWAIFNQYVPIKSVSWNYLKAASGTNEWMFAATDWSWSNSTYYCDRFASASSLGLFAGGAYNNGAIAGAFFVTYDTVSNDGSVYCGSRLMFL